MSGKIRVRITARQMVSYDQLVLMTPEEWEQFKGLSPRDAADRIGGWVDLHNVDEADEIDEDDFEAEVVDESGKSVQPLDYYGV